MEAALTRCGHEVSVRYERNEVVMPPVTAERVMLRHAPLAAHSFSRTSVTRKKKEKKEKRKEIAQRSWHRSCRRCTPASIEIPDDSSHRRKCICEESSPRKISASKSAIRQPRFLERFRNIDISIRDFPTEIDYESSQPALRRVEWKRGDHRHSLARRWRT